jgi:hypothetical protein
MARVPGIPAPLKSKRSQLEELAAAFGGAIGSEGGPRTFEERNQRAMRNIASTIKAVEYVRKAETMNRLRSFAPSQSAKAIVSTEEATNILLNLAREKGKIAALAQKAGKSPSAKRQAETATKELKRIYPWSK